MRPAVEGLEGRQLLNGARHRFERQERDAYRVGMQAYVYGFPLVMVGQTAAVNTNVPESGGHRAPWNQFVYGTVAGPDEQDVVLPNVNVLYANAFLNLSAGPQVLTIPGVEDRFFLLEIMNGWTDVEHAPGTRQGTPQGDYLLAGPGWQGAVPADIDGVFRMRTDTAWIAGRTYTTGEAADVQEADAIQRQYTLTPLGSWGTPYTPPSGLATNPAIDMTTPPPDQVTGMGAGTYFATMAAMMTTNPPLPRDAPIVREMRKVGLVPGQNFNIQAQGPAVRAGLERAARDARRLVASTAVAAQVTQPPLGGWMMETNLGVYGTDYLLRAVTAYRGLGANRSTDAVYAYRQFDASRARLNGRNTYTITFPGAQALPPVSPSAFWSVTIYDAKGFLGGTPNTQGSTQIGPLGTWTPAADGSYRITVSRTRPTDGSAWLVPPKADGDFILLLRMYMPEAAVLQRRYTPPQVVRVAGPGGPSLPTPQAVRLAEIAGMPRPNGRVFNAI
jgi:hypothetical protein